MGEEGGEWERGGQQAPPSSPRAAIGEPSKRDCASDGHLRATMAPFCEAFRRAESSVSSHSCFSPMRQDFFLFFYRELARFLLEAIFIFRLFSSSIPQIRASCAHFFFFFFWKLHINRLISGLGDNRLVLGGLHCCI